MTDESDQQDDVIKRITTARSEGDPWFEVKIILPYDDSEQGVINSLQTNMTKLLSDGLELMAQDDMKNLPEQKPSFILPN